MATTSYFEQQLLATDNKSNADPKKQGCVLEILVSSFSGEHQLYLRHIDSKGIVSNSVIPKKQANELLDGLQDAMHYLSYTK